MSQEIAEFLADQENTGARVCPLKAIQELDIAIPYRVQVFHS